MKKSRNGFYKVLSDITEEESRDLDEFLGSRMDTPILVNMIEQRSEYVGTLYRGINYRKRDLKVGQFYEHWYELSSWSRKKEVAIRFALDDYIPEGCIDDVLEEWGVNPQTLPKDSDIWNEVNEQYAKIVLVFQNGYGFYVNRHLSHDPFSKEEEVIVKDGAWKMTAIKEKKNEKGQVYYEVQVSVAEEAVA